MSTYIENILTGIKTWVEGKIEDISYVTASHLNSLSNRVENIENSIVESSYSERALYTTHETDGDIMATGKVIKCKSKISLFVSNADTLSGQQDVYYALPYTPDAEYVNLINDSSRLYEYSGIQFKIELTTQTIDGVIYNVIKLNRYANGSIVNWESSQSISFRLDYIAESV